MQISFDEALNGGVGGTLPLVELCSGKRIYISMKLAHVSYNALYPKGLDTMPVDLEPGEARGGVLNYKQALEASLSGWEEALKPHIKRMAEFEIKLAGDIKYWDVGDVILIGFSSEIDKHKEAIGDMEFANFNIDQDLSFELDQAFNDSVVESLALLSVLSREKLYISLNVMGGRKRAFGSSDWDLLSRNVKFSTNGQKRPLRDSVDGLIHAINGLGSSASAKKDRPEIVKKIDYGIIMLLPKSNNAG